MRALLRAIFRVFLIFAFIQLTSYLINFISNFSPNNYNGLPEDYNSLPYILGATIVYIVLTFVLLLLWWKTDRVIKFVSGDISDNEIVIHTSNDELYRVIMQIIGIIIVILNVPEFLVTLCYNIFFYN